MEIVVENFNLAQRLLYWATYVIVTILMAIFYVLKGLEEIVRHHTIRYIRLWKQEIDQ